VNSHILRLIFKATGSSFEIALASFNTPTILSSKQEAFSTPVLNHSVTIKTSVITCYKPHDQPQTHAPHSAGNPLPPTAHILWPSSPSTITGRSVL
jgi:hypothetical protein